MIAGLFCAVLSAVCNGSFGSLSKLDQCRAVHPYIFNFWVCQGIVVSSLVYLIIDLRRAIFEPLGLLSGLFFTFATANSFAAISSLGLSVASGVWCGTAVLVSFVYGQAVQHEDLANLPLAMASLVVLVAGIGGIAASSLISSKEQPRAPPLPPPLLPEDAQVASAPDTPPRLLPPHSNGAEEGEVLPHPQRQQDEEAEEQVLLEPSSDSAAAGSQTSVTKRIMGLIPAVLAGIFGGLVLAPMGFAPPDHQGLMYIPSMGLGVLLASPVVTWALLRSSVDAALAPRFAAVPGIVAGTIWNVGNGASIIAVKDPSVGLSVGYPIMQCGLAVAGLWGVLVFHEIQGRAQGVYWASAAVIIAGASLLAVSKT